MKIKYVIIPFIILLIFSSCAKDEKKEIELQEKIVFSKTEGELEVKSIYFSDSGELIIESIGYADKKGFHLDKPRLNGQYTKHNEKYFYKLTENFTSDTQNAKGIVLYRGICYAVNEEENTDFLVLISDNTFERYHKKYELKDFLSKALSFYNEYENSASGGYGLIE